MAEIIYLEKVREQKKTLYFYNNFPVLTIPDWLKEVLFTDKERQIIAYALANMAEEGEITEDQAGTIMEKVERA